MTALEALGAVANIATAIGVGVAAWQLFVARHQATTAFEDSLTAQYRALIERIPIQALLGEKLPEPDLNRLLPSFYRYFDLCNEQTFLQRNGRISAETWTNWKQGIISKMQRPSFRAAWSEIALRAPHDFDHLRELCPTSAGQRDNGQCALRMSTTVEANP